MTSKGYEAMLDEILMSAQYANHSLSPCQQADIFVPRASLITHIVCIQMNHTYDYDTWLALASCWHIWDLDARGFHKR